MGTFLLNAVGGYILALLLVGFFTTKASAKPFEQFMIRIGVSGRISVAVILLAFGAYAYKPAWLEGSLLQPLFWCAYLLHMLNFWVHEGGHFLLSWAPTAVHIVGGTIFDVGIPVSLATWYSYHRLPVCAALASFWAGFTLPSVGRYVADARAMQLSGLTNDGIHDWNWLLGHSRLLEYDQTFGTVLFVAAVPATMCINDSTKTSAGTENANTPMAWANGFEALSSLDQNKDGELRGEELDSISLWFDANQDAVSQPGEVVPLSVHHIIALRTRPDGTDATGRNVVARAGGNHGSLLTSKYSSMHRIGAGGR